VNTADSLAQLDDIIDEFFAADFVHEKGGEAVQAL